MKAVWNGVILAEAPETVTIEGNEYFPPESVHREYFVPSDTPYTCPWKGVCTYYSLMVEGQELKDAAFTYEQPKAGAVEKVGHEFASYVAFWRGVEIS
jgi:uncharacterized protein (DUF427 family)